MHHTDRSHSGRSEPYKISMLSGCPPQERQLKPMPANQRLARAWNIYQELNCLTRAWNIYQELSGLPHMSQSAPPPTQRSLAVFGVRALGKGCQQLTLVALHQLG